MPKATKEKRTFTSATRRSRPLTSKNAQSKLPAPPKSPDAKDAKGERKGQRRGRLRVNKDGGVNWNKVDVLPHSLKLQEIKQRPSKEEATRKLKAEINRTEQKNGGRDSDIENAGIGTGDKTGDMTVIDGDVGSQARDNMDPNNPAKGPTAPRKSVKKPKLGSMFIKKRNRK